jgi:hypothetical protein
MITKIEDVMYRGYIIEVSQAKDAQGVYYSCMARHETLRSFASGAFTEQEGKDAAIDQVKIYIDKYLKKLSHDSVQ